MLCVQCSRALANSEWHKLCWAKQVLSISMASEFDETDSIVWHVAAHCKSINFNCVNKGIDRETNEALNFNELQ